MLRLDSMYWHEKPKEFQELENQTCAERVGTWAKKLRQFSEKHPDICCSLNDDKDAKLSKRKEVFCTNSKYEGTWNSFGMNGRGVYTFPNGVKYTGGFRDNMFHGWAQLKYPGMVVLEGEWFMGLITEPKLYLGGDSLKYDFDEWMYCRMTDRRFKIEYDHFIQPSGKSFLTNRQLPRKIPEGFYDTEDGFYDPKTKFVYKYENLGEVVRKPGREEQEWIITNCRTSSDEPLGPRIDLYEQFVPPQQFLEDAQVSHHADLIEATEYESHGLKEFREIRQSMDVKHLRSKIVHEPIAMKNIDYPKPSQLNIF